MIIRFLAKGLSMCFKFIFQTINAIPDQDIFYDVTDALEEQGLEKIIQFHMNRKNAESELLEQFQIYNAVLSHEDGEDSQTISKLSNIRSV